MVVLCPLCLWFMNVVVRARCVTSLQVSDLHAPSLGELRGLLKTLITGLKNIIWGVSHCNQATVQVFILFLCQILV